MDTPLETYTCDGCLTVSTVLAEKVTPLVAEIVVVPRPADVANPFEPAALLMVAAAVLEDAHVTWDVRYCCELSV
jgi:hypothetical protein